MDKVKSQPRTMNGASQQALNERWNSYRTKSIKKYQAKQRAKQTTKKKSSKKETTDTLTKKLTPVYNRLRHDWLPHNRMCLAKLEGCRGYANQIHHMAGRRGWWLIVMKFFLPVCSRCHRKITDDSDNAINSGLSVSINSDIKYDFNKHTLAVLKQFNIDPPE